MSNRFLISAIATASMCAASLPALAQGRVLDRNASNNPEIYQQTHPEDRSNPQLQGPAAPAPAPRGAERTARERNQDRREAQRRESEHRQGDRHHREWRAPERRDYGYVVPRPYYYYSGPPVYYGSVPPAYYSSPYGYNPPPVLRQGDYLPPEYLRQQFIVTDWYWRGLSEPPYGYQWLVLGPDNYALVAVANGHIVSLVVTR